MGRCLGIRLTATGPTRGVFLGHWGSSLEYSRISGVERHAPLGRPFLPDPLKVDFFEGFMLVGNKGNILYTDNIGIKILYSLLPCTLGLAPVVSPDAGPHDLGATSYY